VTTVGGRVGSDPTGLRRSRRIPIERVVPATGLLTLAAALVIFIDRMREAEARLAAIVEVYLGLHTQWVVGTSAFVFRYRLDGTNSQPGLDVTSACSSVVLLAPLFALAALVVLGRAVPWRQFGVALAAATVGLLVVNQIRLAVIVVFIRWLGFTQGYDVAHIFVGSVIAFAAFAAVALMLLRIAFREPSSGRDARHGPGSDDVSLDESGGQTK
jgi:exosortase/archaeosortase family protein